MRQKKYRFLFWFKQLRYLVRSLDNALNGGYEFIPFISDLYSKISSFLEDIL